MLARFTGVKALRLGSGPACLVLLTVALAVAWVLADPRPAVRISGVGIGSLVDGAFVPRPERIFRSGEPVAAKVTVAVNAASSCRLSVRVDLLHPLGPTLAETSSVIDVPEGISSWDFVYRFNIGEQLPSGYYRLRITATACGEQDSYDAAFLYLGSFSTVNRIELEYTLEIVGTGTVEKLLLALPSDPTLEVLGGPVITPKPTAVVGDSLGNSYALFSNLDVRGSLRIVVQLWALQRVRYVATDTPFDAPLPADVERFLKPSPYIESVNPQIVSLARLLVSNATTYREAIGRIADFVSSTLAYDEGIAQLPHYYNLSALWALNAKKGACLQFSRLFVALARAAGIPARVVEGFNLRTPTVTGERYAHAYAEAYVPGYGWVFIEPQLRGSSFGLEPPQPGYVALVRGSGEIVEVGGLKTAATPFFVAYSGSLSASLRYSASVYPLEQPVQRLSLCAQVPASAYYGERLRVAPQVAAGRATCEIAVRGPSSSFVAEAACEEGVELELNDVGDWSIEVFAWRPGYSPAYGRWVVDVKPRPLNVTVKVDNALLLRWARVTAGTTPPVAGASVRLTVRLCTLKEEFSATTSSDGTAAFTVGPLLLPCPLEVFAEAEKKGYTRAETSVSVGVAPSPELIVAVSTALALLILWRRTKKPS